MKRTIALGIALFLIFATGCTPAKRVEARNNADQIVEIAAVGLEPVVAAAEVPSAATEAPAETQTPKAASPLYEKLGAPTRYQVTLTPSTDKLAITVDADVILPNVGAIPTMRIAARDFTQEEVSKFFHAFCDDTTMYLARTEETRAEIQQRIDEFREELKTASGQRKTKVEENITYYEKELEKAPETIQDVVTDGTMTEQQYGDPVKLAMYMGFSAREQPETTFGGKVFGARNNYYDFNTKANYDFNIGAGIGYGRESRWGSLLFANPIEYIRDETVVPAEAAGELTMTPLEARSLVETFWQEHGFTDMGVLSVFLANNQDTETMKVDEHDTYGQKHAYVVTCGQLVNGVIPVSISAMWDGVDWRYEDCYFCISDAGIESFHWGSPNEYVETVTADTEMLPFSRIDEIFRKMVLVKYESSADGNATGKLFTYNVDHVMLEWQRIFEQGSKSKGLMVPVWNFYGTFEFQYTNGDHYGSETRQGFYLPLLSINAVDGSIVDLREGY
ncbi:MAG: DUF6034 family protein [Christensenella sp.]|nr:DUF6034 family protein [Christensenella sp.]